MLDAALAGLASATLKCLLLRLLSPSTDAASLGDELADDGASALVTRVLRHRSVAREVAELTNAVQRHIEAVAAKDRSLAEAVQRRRTGAGRPGRNLDDGERAGVEARRLAVVEAVRATLDAAALSPESLVRVHLDATSLRASLLRHAPAEVGQFDEAERELFHRCVHYAAEYVVTMADGLPSVRAKTFEAILSGLRDLYEEVRRIHGQLAPALAKPQGGADERYRAEYLRHLANTLGDAEVYGLDLNTGLRKFALGETYVELDASPDTVRPGRPPKRGDPRPVTDVLRGRDRLLLRGVAGSGKSCFLQRIALESMAGRLSLYDGWNKRTPFLIQLRYCTDGLPDPRSFCGRAPRFIAEEMPDGWVHREIRDGRALLLVDGYDELPPDRREEVAPWLAELAALDGFDRGRVVLTSRPDAAGPDAFAELGFQSAELEPMNAFLTDQMISKWHDFTKPRLRERYACGNDEVDELAASLRRMLLAEPALARLASTPLFCALLCIVNVVRRSHLAEEPTEIFELGLRMLIDLRDRQGKVPFRVALSARQLRIIHQKIAYRMMHGSRTTLARPMAAEIVAEVLPALPDRGVDVSPGGLLDYCIDRVGLLRVNNGSADIHFVHHFFQEYLAACQALERKEVDVLVSRAHEEWWANVVTMAAWRAGEADRDELLAGLLGRAESADPSAGAVGRVALGAARYAPMLGPELQQRRDRLAERLELPTSREEAPAFAAAGWALIGRLGHRGEMDEEQAVAALRVLSSVGGRAALDLLAGYAADRRPAVIAELLRCWERFPQEDFGERVVRRVEFSGLASTEQAKLWARLHLTADKQPSFQVCVRTELLARCLGCLVGLTELTMVNHDQLRSLEGIKALKSLKRLSVEGCWNLADIGAVAAMSTLERLDLVRCGGPFSVRPLLDRPSLRRATLVEVEILDIETLIGITWECEFLVSNVNHQVALRKNPKLEVKFTGPEIG
jgi:hypothetical protein